MNKLSVILPSYNEEKMIRKVSSVIGGLLSLEEIEYELIFVDDGSKDDTWQKIREVSETDEHIVGVHFSRNFGKEAAIFAGLASASGACCAVMDCDLQHPPETLIEMYRLWQGGYEVVEGIKKSRGNENVFYKQGAKLFYRLISKAVKIDMSRASDFKLLDRQAVEALLSLPERNSFFRALSSWVGYKTTYVEFDVREREEGESKWSLWSLIKYAITNIAAFSTAPMQVVTVAGGITLILAIVLGIETLIRYFTGHAVAGFTTVILLILFIGSMLMISLGIIGYYIAKIYEEVKCRPRYIISKVIRGKRSTDGKKIN